jgi:hypothetical protein
MTREEYNNELSKSNEMIGLNQDKLNEKVQVRDEVAKLKRESDMNMEAAVKLREQARPIYDDIERADYYRQAYALEALAINQQRQIQTICGKLEMLNQYTEPQLAMLKSGTVPADLRESKTEAASTATETAAPANTALEQAMAENAAIAQQANPASETSSTPVVDGAANVATSTDQPTSPTSVHTAAENLESQNAAAAAAVAVSVENESPAANAATEIATETVIETQTATVAVENKIEDASTFTTRAETADPAKAIVVEAAPIAENKTALVAPAASEAKGTPIAPAASEGRAKASANAADYYYSMPSEVVADLFAKTARGVYSDARPIPVDMEMPKGVYYKVQIGAFRNDIPQNLYDQFAPISGERLNTGITRYTAGFFVQFENAKDVKQQIRAMGYGDAFIVAYRDGKRIPLYEAASITDGPELAASIKAAFEKAAVGSVAQNTNAAANATSVASANSSSQQVNGTANGSVSGTASSNQANAANNNAQAANKNATELNVDAEVAAELARKPATRSVQEIDAAAAKPKKTDYYKADQPQVAAAEQVEKIQGLFYTVQVGVYSKPVAAALLQNVNPLNSELTETNKIRYTSGQYNNMNDAVAKRDEIRKQGIVDAFVTAYYNGNRITLSEADLLLKEKGAGILSK